MIPAAAGPLLDGYITVKARFLRVVRIPNRGSVRFLNLIIHYVNEEKFGSEKRCSVFRDGPLCEAVRYRVSTVYKKEHTLS